ncbi:hypothetical protein EVAR_5030_1 [Eumeta japonica]|uniref:Uncharacterized protein n=1 Tax=Eumeta variegata TaxID=151549 RepID=A0A4C1SUS0_EUMVA|nr:hypothetical protein EVAR_5030_1 [Eumeta japonica]
MTAKLYVFYYKGGPQNELVPFLAKPCRPRRHPPPPRRLETSLLKTFKALSFGKSLFSEVPVQKPINRANGRPAFAKRKFFEYPQHVPKAGCRMTLSYGNSIQGRPLADPYLSHAFFL